MHDLMQPGAELNFDDLVAQFRAEMAQERIAHANRLVEIFTINHVRGPSSFHQASEQVSQIGALSKRKSAVRKESGQHVAEALAEDLTRGKNVEGGHDGESFHDNNGPAHCIDRAIHAL